MTTLRRSKKPSTKVRKAKLDKKFAKTRWDGTIDDEELIRAGGALLAMLFGRARQAGHSKGEMAKHLGVTYSYISQLGSGHRSSTNISEDFARLSAEYLGVPKMYVLLAAGVINPEDMYENQDDIPSALPRAIEYIQGDKRYGPLLTRDITGPGANPRTQLLFVMLYEKVIGAKLIPGEHSLDSILQALNLIEERRRKLLKQVHG